MQTSPEVNEIIVDLIQDSDHLHVQYAAARIEELEQQLAVMWGDDGPHESGAECISCERPAMQETWPYCQICLLTGQLEVCDEGFGDAMKRIEGLERQLETERQEHQDVEWERNALRERIVRHISDQLDYWKQEAAR